jgi:hypothetical protein
MRHPYVSNSSVVRIIEENYLPIRQDGLPETFLAPPPRERKREKMSGKHRKPSTATRQKQAMKAGAVAAPLAAGLMLSAANSASAADSASQPTPQAQSGYPQPGYPVPQKNIATDLATQNGFNTGTETNPFTFIPGSANAPKVSSPTANLQTDCANAAQSGTPCQIANGQFDPGHSFQMIQEGEHYGPSVPKATESSMTNHAVKHPTTTHINKVSEQVGVKAGATGGFEIPFLAEAKVSGEVSSTTGYEHTWQHNPEEITDTNQKQTGLEFNPSLSPNGAHVEQRDLTAAYTGGSVSVNNGPILDSNRQPYLGSNGQPINDIVEIDDGAEYQRTLNKPTTFIAENAPPPSQQPAPVVPETSQQQPLQQEQPQALPSSYWKQPNGPQPELGADWSTVPGGGTTGDVQTDTQLTQEGFNLGGLPPGYAG